MLHRLVVFSITSLALAAQLQQDEYDDDDRARQHQTRSSGSRHQQGIQASSNTDGSVSVEQRHYLAQPGPVSSGQSNAPNGRGETRPEELVTEPLAGRETSGFKKPKDKPSEGKKSKKGCIIS